MYALVLVKVASMASTLLNGERVIVLIFITKILFSTPSSLLPQALTLLLLVVSALFLEIIAESSNAFLSLKTRRGASSGLLLGAVTLPALTFSKLIQLSRALLLEQVELQELKYQSALFWVTCASCFGVLVYLCFDLQCSSGDGSISRNSWRVKLGSITVIYSAVIYLLLLSAHYYDGLHLVQLLSWMVCHSIAAALLIQHILHSFPLCASIGEALLVTAGLIVYTGDMARTTLVKIHSRVTSSEDVEQGIKRSEISIIIQVVLIGLLIFPRIFKIAVKLGRRLTRYSNWAQNDFGRSVIFFSSLALYLGLIIPSWLQFVEDFHGHPLLWVLMFVFSEPYKRLSLCIYWLSLIYVSVCRFYKISKNSKMERILLRKYYHLLAVSMFVPALVLQPNFLNLAFGVALASFLVLEIIRVWRIWPLGKFIHQFMNAFTDHRDSELLIVSHFSLLLGCAIPIWMSSGFNDRPLAPFAGILSLGIGDTMASMVGHKYGVLRWSKTGRKTIEGTAAGITSVLAACLVLLPVLASTGYILTQNWCSLLVAVTVSGLLEAYTAQLDNAFIPLVFYSLLCL